MVLLLLSILVGYAAGNVFRDFRRFPWKRSSATFYIKPAALIGVALVLVWYFDVFECCYPEKLLQILAGAIIGMIAGHCIRTGTFSTAYAVVIGVIFVVGAGPDYWRETLKKSGVVEIAGIKFDFPIYDPRVTLFDTKTILIDPKIPYLSLLKRLSSASIPFDFGYIHELSDTNGQLEIDKRRITRVLDATLTPLSACGDHADRTFGQDARIGEMIQPVAANLSELLKAPLGSITEDTAGVFIRNLNTSMEGLRALFLEPPEECQIDENLRLEGLETFVRNSKTYPYAAISLGYLLGFIGNEDMAKRVLEEWIESYRKDPSRTDSMTSLEVARTRVNLVRAHYVLEGIARGFKPDSLPEIRLAYIDSLRDLLGLAEIRGLVFRTPSCDRNSEDVATKLYLFSDMGTKNNFSYWVGQNKERKYRKEALEYSEEVERYRIKDCNTHLEEEQEHIFSVESLDTFAFVKQFFAIHDYRVGEISKEEFECQIKKAISAWENAIDLQNLIEGKASLTGRPSPTWRLLDHRLKDARQMIGQMRGSEGCK